MSRLTEGGHNHRLKLMAAAMKVFARHDVSAAAAAGEFHRSAIVGDVREMSVVETRSLRG
jgi:hypothetical protein